MNKNPETQGNDDTNQHSSSTASVVTDHAVVVEQGQPVPVDPSDKLIVTEATLETEMPDGTTVETKLVPKKSRKGLVAVIVTLIILVIAAIGAVIWYFVYYSNPEKVAYDAISGLFTEKVSSSQMLLTGKIGDPANSDTNVKFWVDVHTVGVGASASTEATLMITPVDANGESLNDPYKFKLSNIVLSDGIFYIRTEDLANAFDDFIADNDIPLGELASVISEVLNAVDDEWWQISVPDVLDAVMADDDNLPPAKEAYACLVNVANQDIKGELAKVYSDHRFIKVAKAAKPAISIAGSSDYDVSFDYGIMADFVNALPGTEVAQGVYNCYNRFLQQVDASDQEISAEDIPKVTAEELAREFSDTMTIQMSIADWGHALTQIDIRDSANPNTLFSIGFEHGKSAEVTAPDNYRPVTELYDDIEDIITEMLLSQPVDEYDPLADDVYNNIYKVDLDSYDWSA